MDSEPRKCNLHIFLKDDSFVEYLNAFLLLPTFSSQVFYDPHLGVFEPVQNGTMSHWTPEDHGLQSSCSKTTLYITHSRLGPALDPRQCEEWVATYRLPLFLKSDLYSEYKLLKLLSLSAASFCETWLQQAKDRIKNFHRTTSRPMTQAHRTRKHSVPARIESSLHTSRASASSARRSARQMRPTTSKEQEQLLKAESKIKILKSKSGMELFRKFLHGKIGEKNLLCWLDIESIKSAESTTELSRAIKDLYKRHTDLDHMEELISQIDMVNGKILNSTKLMNYQEMSFQKLKQYWYPRFLINFLTETSASLPALALSTTPIRPVKNAWKDNNTDDPASHTSLKSHTPTFRKLPTARSSHQLHRTPNRSTSAAGFGHTRTKSTPSLSIPDPKSDQPTSTHPPSSCRLIWSRDSARQGEEGNPSSNMYIERSSRLAAYNRYYPLVPCGRTSSMSAEPVLIRAASTPVHPPASPQILSVSGTPVPLDQYHTIREDYKSLLNCLSLEKRKAGGYFQKHLEMLPEKNDVNRLFFWQEVQEYKELFIQCTFSVASVEMKARLIYGKYIVKDSPCSIHCPTHTVELISGKLWPAFEDLFDEAEEHVLSYLLIQWKELCALDEQAFENLQYLEQPDGIPCFELEKLSEEYSDSRSSLASTESDWVLEEDRIPDSLPPSSQQNGDHSNGYTISDSPIELIEDEEEEEKMVDERRQIPKKKEMAFCDILAHPRELECFKIYLNDNNGAVHLMCWMEIEAFRALPSGDKVVRNMKAKQIRSKYFTKKYFFGPQSPISKELQRQVVNVGRSHKLPSRPKSSVFREAQKHIRVKIETFVRSFVQTPEFLERHGQFNKKEGEEEKDNTWDDFSAPYTESRETILLRKALENTRERKQFQQFISIQSAEGTCPEKNVDFWLEVQRYKEMFHSQMNHKMLQTKMKAIIYCYFQSPTPPRIQVNVQFKLAEEVVKKQFGPYVFRETQAAVFKQLQSSWNEFQNYIQAHSNRSVEGALHDLQLHITEQRQKMKEQTELLKKEEERNKLSLPRFETLEEKKARLQHEKELIEFGDIAVSFRLSHMNPQYTYFISDGIDTCPLKENIKKTRKQAEIKKGKVHFVKQSAQEKSNSLQTTVYVASPINCS